MGGAPKLYVEISGGIGTGKSSWARQLAVALDVPPLLERPDDNPYLAPFYRAPERWAVESNFWFLIDQLRLRSESQLRGGVQDCSPYDAVLAFGALGVQANWIPPNTHAGWNEVLMTACALTVAPAVMLNLTCRPQTQMARIAQRGRDYERDIQIEYLVALERERTAGLRARDPRTAVIHVDTDELDPRSADDVRRVATEITALAALPPL